MTQDKLRQDLSKAGFKDAKVVDATYVVRAQGPNGSDIMMFVNPPTVGSAAMSGSNASGSASADQFGQQEPGLVEQLSSGRLQLPAGNAYRLRIAWVRG